MIAEIDWQTVRSLMMIAVSLLGMAFMFLSDNSAATPKLQHNKTTTPRRE